VQAGLADEIAPYSKPMAVTLKTVQNILRSKWQINFLRGFLETTLGDKASMVKWELIARSEGGGDELRLTLLASGAEENLYLFPDKLQWYLMRTLGDSDTTTLAQGSLTPIDSVLKLEQSPK
jgi:hypothetical protein